MNSNGNTNADTATVYGGEVHVPGLSDWLAEIDQQGYVMIPDWISPERVKRLGQDLRREVNPIRELMEPQKTTNATEDQSRLAIAINFNLAYLRQQENQYIGVPRTELAKMPERLQRVLGYQQGMSVAGSGMVDLRDPLKMVDRVHFGYDINDPDMPAIG